MGANLIQSHTAATVTPPAYFSEVSRDWSGWAQIAILTSWDLAAVTCIYQTIIRFGFNIGSFSNWMSPSLDLIFQSCNHASIALLSFISFWLPSVSLGNGPIIATPLSAYQANGAQQRRWKSTTLWHVRLQFPWTQCPDDINGGTV